MSGKEYEVILSLGCGGSDPKAAVGQFIASFLLAPYDWVYAAKDVETGEVFNVDMMEDTTISEGGK